MPHAIAFSADLTGFTITDAIELEDEESPILEDLLFKI